MKEVKPPRKPLFYYYGIALVVLLLINFLLVPLVARHAVQEVDYGTFMTMTENKEIGKVEVEDNQIIFTNKDGSKVYKTGPMNDPDLTQRLYDAGAEFTRDIVEETSPLLSFVLTWILPIIIFIAIGVALLGRSAGNDTVALCGMAGALLHTLNHSFFKSLLFFGAGNLYAEAHTTALDRFGGVARQMPVTAILFLAGTAAICALPPLNGFVSEFIIYTGMFRSIAEGQQVLLAAAGVTALALIGGLALFAFTKLYGIVFLGAPRTHEVAEMHEADNYRIAAMALPLAGILFVGLFPGVATGIATRAAAFFLPTPADTAGWLLTPTLQTAGRTVWLLLLVAGALYWLRRRLLRNRPVTEGPTWGCGFTAPNVRMQYTGESFSEGLQSIATSLTQNSGQGSPVGKGEIFPAAHSFDIGHRDRIGRLFAAWWVELLRVINQRVMRLRTGKINHYILFALLFIVLVFLCSILNLL